MTPARMAALHALAFVRERPWRAEEFAGLMDSPHVVVHGAAHGFALARSVAGETELLTLAVDPAQQRQGIGRKLTEQWLAQSNAETAFLEVAADNTGACALYTALGFAEAGRRPAYYARRYAAPVDAILMRRALP